jgi:hypothetical protein
MENITIYPNIKDTIKRQAERHRMRRKGRGTTHEHSYLEGARLVLDLLKSGKYSLKQFLSV